MAPLARSLRVRALALAAMAAVGPVRTSAGAVPGWPATYNMSLSTAFMPCNYSGVFDVAYAASWGVADFDWCVVR
jgi:hypothetical protein